MFPSLEKVVILERLPRADSDLLCQLSEHSNDVLRQATESSVLSDKIAVVAHSSQQYNTKERMTSIFGLTSSPQVGWGPPEGEAGSATPHRQLPQRYQGVRHLWLVCPEQQKDCQQTK